MPRLVVTESHGARQVIELSIGSKVRFGRGFGNEVVLADPELSRGHFEVFESGGQWFANDRGSLNGTSVDGAWISTPTALRPGSTIVAGGTRVDFEESPQSGSVTLTDARLAGEGTIVLSGIDVQRALQGDPAARRLAVLEKATLELLALTDIEALLPRVLELVHQALEPRRAAIVVKSESGDLECSAALPPARGPLTVSRTVARLVFDERSSVLTADASTDERLLQATGIMGVGSLMAVPLWDGDRVQGMLYTDATFARAAFTEDDLRLLGMLGNVAAIQMRNAALIDEKLEKERLKAEALAAAEMQRRCFPASPPTIEGYAADGRSTPCYEVGGDFFDFVDTGEDRHICMLGDVAGKGMGAAILMSMLHAVFHELVQDRLPVLEIARRLNDTVLRHAPRNRFVTFVLADLDARNHRVTWVNCGHAPSPLLVRADGEVIEWKATGAALGLLDIFFAEAATTEMKPGDTIVACSDGVTEEESATREPFGFERLQKIVVTQNHMSPHDLRRAIETAVLAYAGGSPSDDVTIICVQREPS